MANDFYSVDGSPATGSSGSSAVIRSEFTRIQSSFDKMPSLTSTGGRLVRVNPGSTALEAMTLTAGAILYGGGNNEVVQGNNFVWNAANNSLEINGNVRANSYAASGGSLAVNPSTAYLEFSGNTTARIKSFGNSPANRGAFAVVLAGSDASNGMTPLVVDANGNTTLANLNATQVGVTNLNATGTARAVLLRAGNQLADAGIPLEIGKDSQFTSEGTGAIYVRSGTGAGNVGLLLGTDKANNTAYIQSTEPSTSYGSKTIFLNPNGGTVRVGILNVNGAASFTTIDATGSVTLNNLNATQVGVTNLNATTRVQTPQIDSVSGTLILKGAGTTALTLTNATANFAADVGVGGLSSGAYVNAVGNVSAGNVNVTGALRGTSAMLSPVNNSLGASITLNNTNFIDVTSVNQGANGTWLAQGVVTIGGGNSIATVTAKLWDGNTVMAASQFTHINSNGIAATATISLQGFITNPTGNIKISVKDNGPSNSTVFFNQSGTGRDTSLSAIRIG
jgi:hypothetical protein